MSHIYVGAICNIYVVLVREGTPSHRLCSTNQHGWCKEKQMNKSLLFKRAASLSTSNKGTA